jgi:hypothetical protein
MHYLFVSIALRSSPCAMRYVIRIHIYKDHRSERYILPAPPQFTFPVFTDKNDPFPPYVCRFFRKKIEPVPGFYAMYPEEIFREQAKEPFCTDGDNVVSEMIAQR